MIISMIAAMGMNHVIGKNNKIPWKLPAEQQYFKEVTMDHVVISGRKNLESMGRPLQGRRTVILTRNKGFYFEGCEVIHSLDEFFKKFNESDEEIFIIGGEEIYNLFLPYSHRLYITIIEENFEGDAYFPEISEHEWIQVSSRDGLTDENNPSVYTFRIYERGNN